MSISTSFLVNGTLTRRPIGSKALSPTSASNLAVLKLKDPSLFWALQSLQCVNKNPRRQKEDKNARNFIVYSSVDPGLPPPEPHFNFLNWIVGFSVTVILPFFTHKWASLLKLKNNVENTVETIEHVVEAVEKVAEEVEKAAENIAEDLPRGSKLRNMVDFVENVAEEVAKDAHQVDEFIDKVQEAEENAERFVESLVDEDKPPKESKDEILATKP